MISEIQGGMQASKSNFIFVLYLLDITCYFVVF
jgi:hypothetical protein